MKATRKIALFLAVLTILAVLAMPLTASAAETTATDKELKTLVVMVEVANATIEGLVKVAQLTPYNDVAWLLFAVDCIVDPVFAYGEKIGVEVVCEYTEYKIDGQLVMIDPLRVINPPPKGDTPDTKN